MGTFAKRRHLWPTGKTSHTAQRRNVFIAKTVLLIVICLSLSTLNEENSENFEDFKKFQWRNNYTVSLKPFELGVIEFYTKSF